MRRLVGGLLICALVWCVPAVARQHNPPTHDDRLNHAIWRIPGHQPTVLPHWIAHTYSGHWGTTDWYHDRIYISQDVPDAYLYSVVAHEWSHIKQVSDYGWDVNATVQSLDEHFHASGLDGPEYAADCMAILQGATWTDYTSCTNHHWRHMARRLLAGHRLH